MDHSPRVTADAPSILTRPLVLVPVFALVSMVGALFPSFSVGANVLVLVTGAALFWLGLSTRLPRRGSPHRLSAHAGWWLLPALVLAGVELVDFTLGSTYDHPTLSGLADPLLEGYPARVAAYFGWLTAYWGLVRL
ncbi:MAG: hypothetical protein JWP76_4644 [Dactylosporangium sp.]|jgi:hypothetical protein|nr:hypothetical protein [Dactylosporangium sp.]